MTVEAVPHCIYGYCVDVDDFKYMLEDFIEYDSLEDWIDDYNRYEWVFFDDWKNRVYFGLPIDSSINVKEVYYEWVLFKLTPIELYINLSRLPKKEKEEGPYFHVFNIWSI